MLTLALGVLLVSTSTATAIVALLVLGAIDRRKPPRLAAVPAATDPAVFLFDDRLLIDATPAARGLLGGGSEPGDDWDRLCAHLARHFPDLADRLSRLAEAGSIELQSVSDPAVRLTAEHLSGLARITLSDRAAEGRGVIVDSLSQRAQEEELALLREVVARDPGPVWRTDAEGRIDWANAAYLTAVAEELGLSPGDLVWPPPRLVDGPVQTGRRRCRSAGPRPHWYDCTVIESGASYLHFATPADAILRAETLLGEFVQTLTRTFAELPIGLAIFDRNRQLAVFNPALSDLTGLAADFLSARPSLGDFLDRLREARILPEPKDYKDWRRHFCDLELAAASGRYEETWYLPAGRAYRVTGRPHPQGAVAFLIEDVTVSVTLTQGFRSEIDLGKQVLDSLDEAICVFSASGAMLSANAAHIRLWGLSPDQALSSLGADDALRIWEERGADSPVWRTLRDRILEAGPRRPWSVEARLRDGRTLECRVTPLTGGATLVGFRPSAPAVAAEAKRPRRRVRRPVWEVLAG